MAPGNPRTPAPPRGLTAQGEPYDSSASIDTASSSMNAVNARLDELHAGAVANQNAQLELDAKVSTLGEQLANMSRLLERLVGDRGTPPHMTDNVRRIPTPPVEGTPVPSVRALREPADLNSVERDGTREGTYERREAIHFNKPELFSGKDKSALPEFLTRARMYIDSRPDLSEHKKVLYVSSYLSEGAFHWFNAHYDLPDGEQPSWLYDYRQFCDKLKQAFGDPNRRQTAERKIRSLRQGQSSVSDYYSTFLQYAPQTGWDENALRSQFEAGLNMDIREAIALKDKTITHLDALVNASIRIDDNRRSLPAYGRRRPETTDYSRTISTERYDGRGGPNRHDRDRVRTTVVERRVDVPRDDTRRSREDSRRPRFDTGTIICYSCGEKGHKAPDCPKRRPERLNAAQTEDSADDESEEVRPDKSRTAPVAEQTTDESENEDQL